MPWRRTEVGRWSRVAMSSASSASRLRRDRALHDRVVGRGVRVRGPALAVAADPGGVELLQASERLDGLRAEERVVAAEQEGADALGARVGQHRVERGEVAVDVVEQPEHGHGTNTIGRMSTAERERVGPAPTTVGGLDLLGPTLTLRYPDLDDAPRAVRARPRPGRVALLLVGPVRARRGGRGLHRRPARTARRGRAPRLPRRAPARRARSASPACPACPCATAARSWAAGSGTGSGARAPTASPRR